MTPERGRFLSVAVLVGAVAVVAMAVVLGMLQNPDGRKPLPGPAVTPFPVAPVVALEPGAVRVLAAGDIGRCGSPGAAATGALLAAIPDATVLALGDNAYEHGSASDFRDCYGPVWGHALGRTIPVPGNHEYETRGASGYFGAFGDAAGTPDAPWRAIELGAWRLYALVSECREVGGCGEGSPQLTWLKADLAAHPTSCVMATLHRPRFSSGPRGPNDQVDPMWRALATAGADVILAGHDHLYERFAPMDAEGRPTDGGMRSWVVGTGGDRLYSLRSPRTGSEARWDSAFGVLELVLRADGYDWQFRAVMGEPFEDTGSGTC